MTAVIDGQLSIFDWMEDFDPAKEAKQAAGLPEIGKITEEEAARIISAMIGVKFVYNPLLEEYQAKVGKITLDMHYDHYDESVNDGKLMICVGCTGKRFGSGSPADSIDEAVEYLKSYIEDQNPVRHPCERRCKVEWGSKTCFERRGQIWNWNDHKWVRDENGQPVIGKKTCDWEPGKGK